MRPLRPEFRLYLERIKQLKSSQFREPDVSDPILHLGDGIVEDAEARVEVLDHAQPLVRLPQHLHARLELLDLKGNSLVVYGI